MELASTFRIVAAMAGKFCRLLTTCDPVPVEKRVCLTAATVEVTWEEALSPDELMPRLAASTAVDTTGAVRLSPLLSGRENANR